MKITAIRPQQKIRNRYSIYCDDRYAFSVSESMLLEQRLVAGQELSEADLKKFKQLSSDDNSFNNALRYAAIRNHSEWEMEQYLKRKNISENQSGVIISKLSDLGFIDDRNFAKSWVENRRLLKPISKRRLEQELRQKHLSSDIIKEALDEDSGDELKILKDLIAKKGQQSSYKDKTRLMGYLSRQGFSYEDIKRALSDD
jgi:regulatory protein